MRHSRSSPAWLSPTMLKHKPIRDAELLIVGCVRNEARTLGRAIDGLTDVTRDFLRVRFFIVESDSTDGTVAELQRLQRASESFAFVTLGSMAAKHPLRADRIAACRNRYLDELRGNPLYAQADYVMVADLDGVNRDLRPQALQSCWGSPIEWDVCTANQLDAYYDIWALRHADWCPVDCHRQYSRLKPLFGHVRALTIAIHSRMARINPRAPWIEVDSAFGGLAIYRREALLVGRYWGLGEGGEICEHVPLHAALRASGLRIFINPALINAHRTDHSSRIRLRARMRRSLEAMGKRMRDRLFRS